MHRILEARTTEQCKLWLPFSDGVEGEVDLSDMAGDIDLCPDSLYKEIIEQQKAA